MGNLNLIGETGTLVLSAVELRDMTEWPASLIEDYLSNSRTLNQVIQIIDVDFGSMALQDANAVAITGGDIDDVTIGATDPAIAVTALDITATNGILISTAIGGLIPDAINTPALYIDGVLVNPLTQPQAMARTRGC